MFFCSSRRRHTRCLSDWSSDVCSSDLVANMAAEWRALWDELGLTADEFVRTTDLHHVRTVQWLFRLCRENGYVYKDRKERRVGKECRSRWAGAHLIT